MYAVHVTPLYHNRSPEETPLRNDLLCVMLYVMSQVGHQTPITQSASSVTAHVTITCICLVTARTWNPVPISSHHHGQTANGKRRRTYDGVEQFTASTTAAALDVLVPAVVYEASLDGLAPLRSSQTTRYALNELADIPRGRVMDMKMAWRASRPASPTTSSRSSSSSMTHIKSPAPADLSAIASQQTGALAVDSWASLPARHSIYHPPTGWLPLRPILYIIHRNKFSAVTTR